MYLKKWLLTLILTGILFPLIGQHTEKEIIKHQKAIEKSKESSKGILSFDTLFYKGNAYCILEVESKFLGSILKGTLKNLDGSLAGYLNWTTMNDYSADPNKNGFMQVSFANEVSSAYIQNVTPERFIVDNHLFLNGVLDPMAAKRFMEAYPNPKNRTTITTIITTNGSGPTISIANRNRSQTIFQSQNKLIQDNVTIGTFVETSPVGVMGKEYQFYNSQNQLVAKAIGEGAAPVSYKLMCYDVGQLNSNYPSKNNYIPSITKEVKVRLAFEAVDMAKNLVDLGIL